MSPPLGILRSLSPLTPPSGLKRACLPAAALAGVLSMQNENLSTNTLEEQPLSQIKSSSVFDVPETVAPAESDDSGAPLGQRC